MAVDRTERERTKAIEIAVGQIEKQFGKGGEETLAQALHRHFANPVGLLYRLQSRAAANGNAREEVITRSGPIRLSVHHLSADRLLGSGPSRLPGVRSGG